MMLESTSAAWGYYLLGAAGLYVVWWRMTMCITWSTVRRVLRAVMLVIILCPFSVAEGYIDMAPAVLMAMLELVFEGEEAFYRAGTTLLGAMAVAAAAALVYDVMCRLWGMRRRRKHEAAQA